MLTLIFLIAFPFALWGAWKNIQQAKASTDWPTVEGTITASERKRVMFRAQPRIAYSYQVDGKAYTSSRLSFANAMPPKETDAILARHAMGQKVAVHYAPANPSQAALEPGDTPQVHSQFKTLIVLFVIVVVVNAALLYVRSLDAN